MVLKKELFAIANSCIFQTFEQSARCVRGEKKLCLGISHVLLDGWIYIMSRAKAIV